MYDNATKVVGTDACVCTSVCVQMQGNVCIKIFYIFFFFKLSRAREVKAVHNGRQSRAGGGDTASGNLDSPVVYL